MIVVGLVAYAVGFCGFIIPNGVVTGGLTGVATLIYFQFGIPIAYSFYVLNVLLLAIAYKLVGLQFVLKTIFGATGLSFLILIAQPFFEAHPIALDNDIFLNVIIGAVLCGTGLGVAFAHNGSTGGTDIIAAMVAKYHQISVGRMVLYCDLIIISSGYFVTHDLDRVVYGYVVLVFLSYMADQVVNNNRQAVQFTIFSRHWDMIATAVNKEVHRGCTVLDGTGWYTKHAVKVLVIFCRKTEALQIFRLVKSIDPKAFVSQGNVSTVYGEGFDENKVRAKLRKMVIDDEKTEGTQPTEKE